LVGIIFFYTFGFCFEKTGSFVDQFSKNSYKKVIYCNCNQSFSLFGSLKKGTDQSKNYLWNL